MKATSIYGGVQVSQIIVQIVKSKFIAILLGPGGMGIVGLLTSTIGFISGLTNFGLGISAVKNVAAADASGDSERVAIVKTVLQRWVWATGLIGTILTLFLSPWLSIITFGNQDFTIAFIWISVTLLFNQLSIGQLALLQGLRKINYLANANLTGSLLGLFIAVPIYYRWGIDGIVPVIISTSLANMFRSWYFANKVKIGKIKISRATTLHEGKEMLRLGFMISLSGIINAGASYILGIYIRNIGGVEQVGLYNACFAIINIYTGMVFSAMATDYYPRLSAVAQSNEKSKEVINQQAEIAILILSPVILIFLVFINWVIIILYSTKFIPINEMIHYSALGMFFKAASWSISFIFLAKGASKLFFWNELIANINLLVLNVISYKYFGLTGLGISFMVSYILYLIQVYVVARLKFEFSFNTAFYKIFSLQFGMAVLCFVVVKLFISPYSYAIGSLFVVLSIYFAYKELDKRIDVKSIILSLKNRLSK